MATKTEQALKRAINAANFGEVVAICENYEFECAEGLHPTGSPFYAAHLLGYLILGKQNAARFLWKRLSKNVKSNPEMKAIWALGKHIWNRNYTEFYTSVSGTKWSASSRGLVDTLRDTFRNNTFRLISTAYSNISVGDAAGLLGLSEVDTRSMALANGWEEKEGSFFPAVPQADASAQNTSLDHLGQLTEYVYWLESK
eukprot:TRINITY_DN3274_c0_g1_i1.p2 TRINITY_DN3274_c0_g1~~TRINITY_DN3274_c0_g1_i1.p2  ORF type:complete len:208 (-),score=39.74 TRINITY_DN3274_c0_g1_i1:739-1335(-)